MRFSPYQTTRSSTVVCCCRLNPRYHCTTKPCIVGPYNIGWTTADDRFFCIIDRYREAACSLVPGSVFYYVGNCCDTCVEGICPYVVNTCCWRCGCSRSC